jgi:hypothetical protein
LIGDCDEWDTAALSEGSLRGEPTSRQIRTERISGWYCTIQEYQIKETEARIRDIWESECIIETRTKRVAQRGVLQEGYDRRRKRRDVHRRT